MFSVWTTQKYVLPKECCKKTSSGGNILLPIIILTQEVNIKKSCWLETEFFSLFLVIYAMTKCSSIILCPEILVYLLCSWPISGKGARWNIIKLCTADVDKRSLTHYRSISYHMWSVEQPNICGPAAANTNFWWIRLRSLFIDFTGNWKGPQSFQSGYWDSLAAWTESKRAYLKAIVSCRLLCCQLLEAASRKRRAVVGVGNFKTIHQRTWELLVMQR